MKYPKNQPAFYEKPSFFVGSIIVWIGLIHYIVTTAKNFMQEKEKIETTIESIQTPVKKVIPEVFDSEENNFPQNFQEDFQKKQEELNIFTPSFKDIEKIQEIQEEEKKPEFRIPQKKDLIQWALKNTPDEKKIQVKKLLSQARFTERRVTEEEEKYLCDQYPSALKILQENLLEKDYGIFVIPQDFFGKQSLVLCQKDEGDLSFLSSFLVSLGERGFGEKAGSRKTPRGIFTAYLYSRIQDISYNGREIPIEQHKVIGAFGQKFSRMTMDEVFAWNLQVSQKTSRMITTAFFLLEGNEIKNQNSKLRGIGIHGTNQEQLVGTPASDGCAAMTNLDILRLYSFLKKKQKSVIVVIDDGKSSDIVLAQKDT
jgi:hypothetical protein